MYYMYSVLVCRDCITICHARFKAGVSSGELVVLWKRRTGECQRLGGSGRVSIKCLPMSLKDTCSFKLRTRTQLINGGGNSNLNVSCDFVIEYHTHSCVRSLLSAGTLTTSVLILCV